MYRVQAVPKPLLQRPVPHTKTHPHSDAHPASHSAWAPTMGFAALGAGTEPDVAAAAAPPELWVEPCGLPRTKCSTLSLPIPVSAWYTRKGGVRRATCRDGGRQPSLQAPHARMHWAPCASGHVRMQHPP